MYSRDSVRSSLEHSWRSGSHMAARKLLTQGLSTLGYVLILLTSLSCLVWRLLSLLILGVKVYCCAWTYSHMHNIHKRNIHDPGRIRTRNPSKPTAIFLRLRQRGHRDRPVIQQQRLTVEGKDGSSNFSRGKKPPLTTTVLENDTHVQVLRALSENRG
jgi:hypothetical protein